MRTPSTTASDFDSCRAGARSGAPSLGRLARLGGLLGLLVGLTLLSAAPASAVDDGHFYSTSFAGSGTNALSTPTSADVDNSAGAFKDSVYVTDSTTHRVEKFTSAGVFVLMFGDEVNATTAADVCTAASGNTCKTGLGGTGAQKLDSPRFLAVDSSAGASSGDIYVADATNDSIHKYDPNGTLITTWGTGGQKLISGDVVGIDVENTNGNLVVFTASTQLFRYTEAGVEVNNFFTSRGTSENGFAWSPKERFFKVNGAPSVAIFNSTGGEFGQVSNTSDTTGLNVDSSTGTLYQVSSTEISEYKFDALNRPLSGANVPCLTVSSPESGCEPTHKFGAGSITGGKGIGVAAASSTLYVADTSNQQIDVFLPRQAPKVTTQDPVADSTVSGEVALDGGGEVTECYFEYGASAPAYGSKVDCSPSTPYTTTKAVTADIPGLTPETTYHYRLVAKNVEGGQSFGLDKVITPHHVRGLRTLPATAITRTAAQLNASFEGNGEATNYYFEWGLTTAYGNQSAIPPGTSAGSPTFPPVTNLSFDISGLTAGTTYHFRIVGSNPSGTSISPDATFVTSPAIKQLLTKPATEVNTTTAVLNGEIDPDGFETTYYFEYGKTTAYGHNFPVPPGNPLGTTAPGLAPVPGVEVTNLEPSTTYHFRIVGRNPTGTTVATDDQAFTTPSAPSIASFSSKEVTATSAVLIAQINPRGEDTTYHFEYGPTIDYGLSAPVPAGVMPASSEFGEVTVPVTGLEGVTYHFRLVAENKWGESHTEDQTFTFYPPSCPNENVRQQTQANFLPDCRAYELVSPGDAGGTLLYARGPNTGYATSPSRFSFTGIFSAIPGAGGKPIVGSGDLYVSTRTSTGWVSRYVGWPADEAAGSAGPPMGPPGSQPRLIGGEIPSISSQMPGTAGTGPRMTSGIITDLSMSRFLTFNEGNQSIGNAFDTDRFNRTPIASNAPRVYAADGSLLERWPQDLSSVPDGSYPAGVNHLYTHGGSPFPGEMPAHVAPGGDRALDCPTSTYDEREEFPGSNFCPGDVTASDDLSHFVFATRWNVFAEGGILDAPGSVYDNDTAAGTVKVASIAPGGGPIMPEPGDKSGDPLQIPAVSRDGSHILMASGGTGPCGHETCPELPCRGTFYGEAARCPMQPSRLYMRVSTGIPRTYEVSGGNYVEYVGTDAAGTKVYFLSDDQLTPEDQDSSTDLYLWTEEPDSITLVSKANVLGGPGEAGNSDDCTGGLENQQELPTTKCGVATYTQWFFCGAANEDQGGGNCLSDNSIAPDSGDIYFYSQEQLDGLRGVPNQQNLYVYHEGKVHYVTTLTGPPDCYEVNFGSFCRRMMRMQVSADGRYMAFVTASRITPYDNDGRREMYRYARDTRELVCVSCIPDGSKPSFDVAASQDGLFMSDDGRAFFTTEDALVHADTNRAQDVYEYVEGRPQLITLGTGDTRAPGGIFAKQASTGLSGVSADASDVYFSTYDTLVRQDRNGLFLKFYDARSGGGFPAPPPAPPCEAADECHGDSSQAPRAISDGTGAALGSGGNVAAEQTKGKKKKKHSKRRKRHAHGKGRAGKKGGAHGRAHQNGRAGK